MKMRQGMEERLRGAQADLTRSLEHAERFEVLYSLVLAAVGDVDHRAHGTAMDMLPRVQHNVAVWASVIASQRRQISELEELLDPGPWSAPRKSSE